MPGGGVCWTIVIAGNPSELQPLVARRAVLAPVRRERREKARGGRASCLACERGRALTRAPSPFLPRNPAAPAPFTRFHHHQGFLAQRPIVASLDLLRGPVEPAWIFFQTDGYALVTIQMLRHWGGNGTRISTCPPRWGPDHSFPVQRPPWPRCSPPPRRPQTYEWRRLLRGARAAANPAGDGSPWLWRERLGDRTGSCEGREERKPFSPTE